MSQGADPDEIGLMNIDEQLPVLEYPQPGLDIIQVWGGGVGQQSVSLDVITHRVEQFRCKGHASTTQTHYKLPTSI